MNFICVLNKPKIKIHEIIIIKTRKKEILENPTKPRIWDFIFIYNGFLFFFLNLEILYSLK